MASDTLLLTEPAPTPLSTSIAAFSSAIEFRLTWSVLLLIASTILDRVTNPGYEMSLSALGAAAGALSGPTTVTSAPIKTGLTVPLSVRNVSSASVLSSSAVSLMVSLPSSVTLTTDEIALN